MFDLNYYAEHNDVQSIETLLKNGTDINGMINGMSALHVAAAHNSKEAAFFLIKNGININLPDPGGRTAFHYALGHGSYEIARAILGLKSNDPGLFWLLTPIGPGIFDLALPAKPMAALFAAGEAFNETGDIDEFEEALDEIEELTPEIKSKAMEAAREDNEFYDEIEELVTGKARAAFEDWPVETDEEDEEIYTGSKEAGPANQPKMFGLNYYAQRNDVQAIETLLKNGKDINEMTNNMSALHTAAVYNSKEAALFLIKNGINVNLLDHRNCSALHYAADHNSYEIAKAILENNGDVNQSDNYGNQPLMTAASNYKGNKERFAIVELLLQHGADKNYKGKSGTSPVDFARIASPSLLELFNRY